MLRHEICVATVGNGCALGCTRLESRARPSVRVGATEELYHDRKFLVAIESPKFSITTENSLS